MARWLASLGVLFGFVVGTTACSSSDSSGENGGGSCGSAPCGGDVVGTWNAQKACVSGSQSVAVPNCSPATVTITGTTPSGTVTFDAGGTWQTALTTNLAAHAVIAEGCYDSTQCTQFEASLKGQPGVTGASCSFGKTCSCDYSSANNDASTGSFQINGTSITLTTDGSSDPPTTDGFCVSGSTLTLTAGSGSGSTGSLVFTR